MTTDVLLYFTGITAHTGTVSTCMAAALYLSCTRLMMTIALQRETAAVVFGVLQPSLPALMLPVRP